LGDDSVDCGGITEEAGLMDCGGGVLAAVLLVPLQALREATTSKIPIPRNSILVLLRIPDSPATL
jgi:hypothetical protein